MRVYDKNRIVIDLNKDSIKITDWSNNGEIYCPLDNITNLLEGLNIMKKDPSVYKHQNCFNGHMFFPTIGCKGNYIILTHIPRIITAIKSSNKINFKLSELNNSNLLRLSEINMYLNSNRTIIKDEDNIDIILYNI